MKAVASEQLPGMFRSGHAAHDAQCRAHLNEAPRVADALLLAGIAAATAKGADVLAGLPNSGKETSNATAEGLALARWNGGCRPVCQPALARLRHGQHSDRSPRRRRAVAAKATAHVPPKATAKWADVLDGVPNSANETSNTTAEGLALARWNGPQLLWLQVAVAVPGIQPPRRALGTYPVGIGGIERRPPGVESRTRHHLGPGDRHVR